MTGITWVGMVSGVPYRWRIPVVAHDHIHNKQHDEREEKATSGDAMGGISNDSTTDPARSHIT
jgi:hypothetical protein